MLITLEGIDGAGKTLACSVVSDWLRLKGFDFLRTSEPGGTGLAKKIRQLILDPENNWNPMAELMLFMADRAQHVTDLVRPNLKEGKFVVCDRFSDSTMAYQGYGRGLDKKTIAMLNEIATRKTSPDLTFLLDVSVELAAERKTRAGKKDRMDGQGLEFFELVRQGFLHMAAAEPERFVIIDANQEAHEVAADIREALEGSLRASGVLDDQGNPPSAGT